MRGRVRSLAFPGRLRGLSAPTFQYSNLFPANRFPRIYAPPLAFTARQVYCLTRRLFQFRELTAASAATVWEGRRFFIRPEMGTAGSAKVSMNPNFSVRYAWAMFPPNPNLYNAEGFPMAPFRTDR